jgi:hypothetical protein
MDEHATDPTPYPAGDDHADEGGSPSGETESTGIPAVDEVLSSLDGLADRPVAEHVAVFEQAHERLRRALDAQPSA